MNYDLDCSPTRKVHSTQDKFNITDLVKDVTRKSSLILIDRSGYRETDQDSIENEKKLSFVSSPKTTKNMSNPTS